MYLLVSPLAIVEKMPIEFHLFKRNPELFFMRWCLIIALASFCKLISAISNCVQKSVFVSFSDSLACLINVCCVFVFNQWLSVPAAGSGV